MRRTDEGSSHLEYLALGVLAAVILGGLLTTGIGGKVASGCGAVICRIVGSANCPFTAGEPSAQTTTPARRDPDDGERAPGTGGWQYADQMPPRAPVAPSSCANAKLPWSEGLHAHNDYQNGKPLTDALDHGATSVEADVWLDSGGRLMVGHTSEKQDPGALMQSRGTLEDLYIHPLRERAAEHGGKIYPGRDKPFELHIEFKDKGDVKAYRAAMDQVKRLPPNVTVVLSGGRPDVEALKGPPIGPLPPNVHLDNAPTYKQDVPDNNGDTPGCAIPPELDPGTPEHPNPQYDRRRAEMTTVINGQWGKGRCGDTDGNGLISDKEQADLDAFVARAHALGYQTRFWDVPDSHGRSGNGGFVRWCPFGGTCSNGQRNDAWHALQHAGSDMLGTNHLGAGENFIHSCGKKF